jgi:RNA polymerase sigma factor (sigma-70 family)
MDLFSSTAQKLNNLYSWGFAESDLEILALEAARHIGGNINDEQTVEAVLFNVQKYGSIVAILSKSGSDSREREAIAEQWHIYLHKIAAKVCGGSVKPGYEIEDVVQVAWLNILRGIKTFHFKCKLETWVYQVVVNAHLGLLRGAGRHPEELWDGSEVPGLYARDNNARDPLDETIRGEEKERFKGVIRECLMEISLTRKRLRKWMDDYPHGLNDLAKTIVEVLIGETSQHALAQKYSWPEPTVSRIIKDMQKSLKRELS